MESAPCEVHIMARKALPLNDPDPGKSQRTMSAMLEMKKLDIEKLKRASAA